MKPVIQSHLNYRGSLTRRMQRCWISWQSQPASVRKIFLRFRNLDLSAVDRIVSTILTVWIVAVLYRILTGNSISDARYFMPFNLFAVCLHVCRCCLSDRRFEHESNLSFEGQHVGQKSPKNPLRFKAAYLNCHTIPAIQSHVSFELSHDSILVSCDCLLSCDCMHSPYLY